jgi:non-ribosomal peptide synthetase component F
MHHIVSDGWSMSVLINEVSVFYEAYSRGEGSPLRELPIQYADYAVWQREWLQGDVLAEQLNYWREQLRGVPEALELPADRARPAVQSFHGASYPVAFTQPLSLKLKELSRREDVTLFMSLLTAFKMLLHYYSKQDDIVVGTNVANRNRAETEGLIGFFVNTVVMRSKLSGDPSFQDLLQQIREVCLDAYAHQDVPFERVVALLQPDRDLSRQPLFQAKIDVDNRLMSALELRGITLTPLEIPKDIGRCDLQLFITETPEGLIGKTVYDSNLFDDVTASGMSKQFEILLHEIVEQPGIRLNALEEVLAESEKQYKITRETAYKNSIRQKFRQVSKNSLAAAS